MASMPSASVTHVAVQLVVQQLGSRPPNNEHSSQTENVQRSSSQSSGSAAPVVQSECEQLPCGMVHTVMHAGGVPEHVPPPQDVPHAPQFSGSVAVFEH